MKNKIFAIIPVYNGLKFTKKCLRSFEIQLYRNVEVIIVDSGSRDGTVKFIKRKYPDYTVIEGTDRWWWTRSISEGVRYALKKAGETDFILTMNNDCFFYRDYLKEILNASLRNRRSVIGSLILDAEDKTHVIDAGVKINWKYSLIYGIADKISNDIRFYTDRKVIKGIDTLPGKGALIPISVFKKIGNFNYRRLPHYIGDYEFFCRAKRNGFKLTVASDARIYNYRKRTGYFDKGRVKINIRNRLHLLFARKSKNNIVDYANFILLCCPRKHLNENLKIIVARLISISPLIYKIRLAMHDFPIRILQVPLVASFRLILHNIPIIIRQSYGLSRIRRLQRRLIKKFPVKV
jgi:GT2 family glycosyltransferase